MSIENAPRRRKGGQQPFELDDQKLRLMRQALAAATQHHTIGGQPKKTARKPKPVTLAPMPWDKR